MTTYTQRDEQRYILEACKDAPRRRLLDIGAWHPTDKSNSRALIEQGWDAVLIEPSPGPVRSLVQGYKDWNSPVEGGQKIIVLCAAVGLEAGIVTLQITDDAVSTAHVTDQWRESGGYLGAMTISVVTLKQIFDWYGDFDFVSIDTEGTSVDLFKQLLSFEMFPRCIVVEHDSRFVELSQAAQARGYSMVYESEENRVYALK